VRHRGQANANGVCLVVVFLVVEPAQIKSQKVLTDLIGYLERNRPYLPCYSVRKHLGLRNSSNRGENANDLVVSDRQKHNGMSWSKPGSVALAAVTALVRNQEYKRWFHTGTLSFAFSPSGSLHSLKSSISVHFTSGASSAIIGTTRNQEVCDETHPRSVEGRIVGGG
jgi:hypothetical protein